ncbi:MAG: ABC-2 transporter permease [Clostridia bacterium]|nr:ABC-2 transporter permease [Clostridia bacterium]
MIGKLLKKEWALCLHPTCFIFLAFAFFVFIPNYPYEVAYFFSGLAVFFVCLTARENGDFAYTCSMPVKKRDVALARIVFCVCFQIALVLLSGLAICLKQVLLPPEMQTNMAGSCANLALLGHGCVLLGLFNIIFFPLYFQKPERVGVPFMIAAIAQFCVIALLCALRFTAPVYSDALTVPDPANIGIKAVFFCVGLVVYLACTVISCVLSMRRFERVNL